VWRLTSSKKATEEAFASAEHVEFIYWRIGDSNLRAGQKDRGLAFTTKALEACVHDDVRCQALFENNLGWALERCGRVAEAKDQYRLALKIAVDSGNTYIQATALNNIAAVNWNPKEAVVLLKEALPLRRAIGDATGEGSTLHNLGMAYIELGDTKTGIDYLTEALPVRRRAHDLGGEAATLRMLAVTQFKEGNFAEATNAIEQAKRVAEVIGGDEKEFFVLDLAWNIALEADDDARKTALATEMRKIIERHERAHDVFLKGEFNNIGKFYYDVGDYSQALTWYSRSIASAQESGERIIEGLGYNNIGKAYFMMKKFALAEEFYGRAAPFLEGPNGGMYVAYLWHNLGLLSAELGRDEAAKSYYDRAIASRSKSKWQKELGESFEARGQLLYRSSKYLAAADDWRAAAKARLECKPPNIAKVKVIVESAIRAAHQGGREDIAGEIRNEFAKYRAE
jgi:tetratricopeptide (TPR) repeat protein